MVYPRSIRLSYLTSIKPKRRFCAISDNTIQLNEAAIKVELKDLVKSSVEETLNAFLEHEADEFVNAERYERSGCREIPGAAEGMKEDHESWCNSFVCLKEHGLTRVQLVIGDKNLGMLETVHDVFPEAKYQRCIVHFYRNVSSVVPKDKVRTVAMMLKVIHAQEGKEVARQKATQVAGKLREIKLAAAAKKVEDSIEEILHLWTFRASTGRRSARATHLNGLTARSSAVLEPSALSPMETVTSCSSVPAFVTWPPQTGVPSAT